jgi:branched-chain amino acid transport system ATP-binding protein
MSADSPPGGSGGGGSGGGGRSGCGGGGGSGGGSGGGGGAGGGSGVGGGGGGRPLLRACGLRAGYGGAPVLRGVDLHVDHGELLAVVGANGAGKTTLVGVLSGLVPLSAGRVQLAGTDLTSLGPEDRVRCGLAVVPEGRRLFQGLTVAENLQIGAHVHRDSEVDGVLELLPALVPLLERRAESLPVAEQSLCSLGRALATRPVLLVVDEPTLGLDPEAADELLAVLPDIAATGCAVAVVEADATRALGVTERAIVLAGGVVVAEGSPGTLLSDLDFVRSYVWGSAG